MKDQMIRVISSPSSSTIGFLTVILAATGGAMLSAQTAQQVDDDRFGALSREVAVVVDRDQGRRLDDRAEQDVRHRLGIVSGEFARLDRGCDRDKRNADPQLGRRLAPTLPAHYSAALQKADPAQLLVRLALAQISFRALEESLEGSGGSGCGFGRDQLNRPPLAGLEDGAEEVQL